MKEGAGEVLEFSSCLPNKMDCFLFLQDPLKLLSYLGKVFPHPGNISHCSLGLAWELNFQHQSPGQHQSRGCLETLPLQVQTALLPQVREAEKFGKSHCKSFPSRRFHNTKRQELVREQVRLSFQSHN